MEKVKQIEIWKDIKGYDGLYQISSYGRVLRKNKFGLKERILKVHVSFGYSRVALGYKTKKQKKFVHRLVAEAFVLNPKNENQVNHIDGDQRNNYYKNLEWVSVRENQTHKWLTKTTSSKFTGVMLDDRKKTPVWQASIGINGKQIYLGRFKNEDEAHQAYLNALKKHGLKNKYATI